MVRDSARRDDLAEAATDYVLEHGLVGLSLRPLAAALGTSDRMLLYHFGSKDELVAAVLRASNNRSVRQIRALPASATVRDGVLDLWRAVSSGALDRCQRVYVEAAALGLLGNEPYATVVREANAVWVDALADRLAASGVPVDRAARAVALMDATFMGFQLDLPLDLPLDGGDPLLDGAVLDLAEAVVAIATQSQGRA
jgi:AcrR family transcriptional regulator